jgi:hypothetical protein
MPGFNVPQASTAGAVSKTLCTQTHQLLSVTTIYGLSGKAGARDPLNFDSLFRASDYSSSGAGTWSVRFSVGVESTLTPVSRSAG